MKLFRGWLIVGAVALALTISGTTFAAGGFGILTAYFTRAYGWTQAQMAPALSVFLLCATAFVPVVGWAADRFGSRRVALCGMTAFAGVLACGALINTLASLYVFYAVLGFVGVFTNPVVYLRTISLWFDRRRGVALGVAVAGQGIGGAMLPMFIQRMAEGLGWRTALLILAGVLLAVLLPIVALVVRDSPGEVGEHADGQAPSADAGQAAESPMAGASLREAAGRPAFWIILTILGLLGMATYALTANGVYLLTRMQTLTLREAAGLGGIGGLSMVGGRVVFGWFMDRWRAPRVGAVGVAMLIGSILILPHLRHFGPLAIAYAMLGGLAGGAETDLLTLLVSRYFGRRALSQIYSWHNVAFLVGAAIGPPVFAQVMMGPAGAAVALKGVIALAALAIVLLLTLGPYPKFEAPRPAAA